MISTIFFTSLWLFIFEDRRKWTFKKWKAKNLEKKQIFCWHLESHWWKKQDPDLDLYLSGTDPRIRVRI